MAIKFKITYDEGKRSYTYNKIKDSASDSAIFNTAAAFASLQAYEAEKVFKVVDYNIPK